ncbi:F-box protein [Striga asiatica]|uniref:F-box protein n=1 Tax=Striga asiatica TaxID=4170 RepID=A0A5A7PG02_STRAF|nr:F-box protein [Striga asiatica]
MSMLKNVSQRPSFSSRYYSRNLSSIEPNPSLHIPLGFHRFDMGMLMLKNVGRRPPSSSRYFSRTLSSIEPIPKSHLEIERKLPLLLRLHGNNFEVDVWFMRTYFSLLSWDDKSLSTQQLHLPFPTINHVSYCEGLVCLDDGFIDDRVALWNPSTNEFKFLPKTSIKLHPVADYLMFEHHVIGFDSNSQDFKVLRFVTTVFHEEEYWPDMTQQLELYSLKSDSWEELPCNLSSDCSYNSASANGVAYWWVVINARMVLLTFDFASKQFSFLDLPDSANRAAEFYELHLAVRDGSLATIFYPKYGEEKTFELWVRSHDGSWEWISTFCVPGVDKPLGFWTKDDLLFRGKGEYLILYHIVTQEVKCLNISDDLLRLKFVPCVESGFQLVGKSEFENKEV